jgi:hypothetical protein
MSGSGIDWGDSQPNRMIAFGFDSLDALRTPARETTAKKRSDER